MTADNLNRDPQAGALIRLRGLYPSLKTALQKVADVILRQPEMAIYASVNEVAAVAGVSEATVMRFCRTLGFKGFQDFKIALAREMVTPAPSLQEGAALGDDPAAITRKVFQANKAALQDTLEILELDAMGQAAQLLHHCQEVMIAGTRGSGPVAAYARYRFLPLGLKVYCYVDFYLVLQAAAILTARDVFLALSHSGGDREIVDAARTAQMAGAKIISVTNNPLSPLARLSDRVLVTASREMEIHQEGIASFICQISVIDSLYALIYQVRREESQRNLARMEAATKP